jgi:hypothetical protein
MTERRDEQPLMWANRSRKKDNVIVLTDRAVFVTTLPPREHSQVGVAFDAGEAPQDVLDSYRVVPLKWVTSFQYQYSTLSPLARVTLNYEEDGVKREEVLSFASPSDRDTFKVELNARLGNWLPSEQERHPAITALKYVAIFLGIAAAVSAVAFADNKGWLDRALGSLAVCVNLCGIWSILFLGVLPCLLAGTIAAREFKHPILTVTFEPQPQEDE